VAKKPPKANNPLAHRPLEIIERAKAEGVREVIVAFSGGKDAIVTLDLCIKHFERVEAYFMYAVPGLSYEEQPLQWAERHYGIKILRSPHWALSQLFRQATFRHFTNQSRNAPVVKVRDYENAMRKRFGIGWIATGEKACDSPQRNGYIRNCNGVQPERLRLYPLSYWSDTAVMSYLSLHRLPTPVQYSILDGKSQFGGFGMESMAAVAEKFPSDFKKIAKFFPLIEAQVVRHHILQKQVPKEHEADGPPDHASGCAVQSSQDQQSPSEATP